MLNSLPTIPHARLPAFLAVLTPLATTHPHLFEHHLRALLSFLPALIAPAVDAGPTPTVARPNPAGASSFVFPPPAQNGKGKEPAEDREAAGEAEEVRKAALEFMISLSEARPPMVRRVEGWTRAVVTGCLEGMGEIPEDETDIWLEAEVSEQLCVPIWRLTEWACSQGTTPRTIRTLMCTSSRLTASHAHWAGRWCCRRHSNLSLRCSQVMTGDCDMRA